jgi:uncharacterized protein (UPF0218 family)
VPYYLLTEALRQSFKSPLGELVTGNEQECNTILKQILTREKPRTLILVGDTISRNAVQSGLEPNVIIIDNLEKRDVALPFAFRDRRIIQTRNPAGRIEIATMQTIEQAILEPNSLIEVDGEEDLLVIPAVLSAPDRSMVVYGQPGAGIVIVRVSDAKKSEVRRILDAMELVE